MKIILPIDQYTFVYDLEKCEIFAVETDSVIDQPNYSFVTVPQDTTNFPPQS